MLNIESVPFRSLVSDLGSLDAFFPDAGFVISHKDEGIETLLGVLWHLPVNSQVIVVTNCQRDLLPSLARGLCDGLPDHGSIYLVHQKDAAIARLFRARGVGHILGADGRVKGGKGEGMYIGALAAVLLGCAWVVFFDADNFAPSALVEYMLALGRLFLQAQAATPRLQNIRICWSSKPALLGSRVVPGVMGRCTSVVSPVLSALIDEWFGLERTIISSNAGEQGMSGQTATTLRFSSGFSVETFQFLELLDLCRRGVAGQVLLQQYMARGAHFHDKKGEEHIKGMIEESLGSFFHFKDFLPQSVLLQLQGLYRERHLQLRVPAVYPALRELGIQADPAFLQRYRPSCVAGEGEDNASRERALAD